MRPEIQHSYRACTTRVLALSFASLLCVGMLTPVQGQSMRRLPNALISAPGNTGITGALRTFRDTLPVVSNSQHPLFESSYTGYTNQVLATTRYGDVTSRDLYLWMLMTDSPNKAYLPELLNKAKFPADRKELAQQLKVEVDNFVFANYIIPRLLPAAPADPVYDFKHHVYTLPVWQTVFLQQVIGPRTCITEADRQKYLQEHTGELVEPQRLRARYIFMRSPETATPEEQDRVEVDMDELRTSILRGETTFAEAARQHSQAPSAKRGGEIPPFQHGELFFLFENAAAELEPGGVSPVFRGPNGLYMVQLIEVIEPQEPSLSNPEQAKKVDEGLSRQVLRASYEVFVRDMLLERRRITENPAAWDSLDDDEAVGYVCDFTICKGQMRSAWPALEGNDLRLKTPELATLLRTTLEREAMAEDVRSLGFDKDPMLERARWMAGNMIRRDAWLDQLRATLPISEQLVRNFWSTHPDLFTPLAMKRVIRLTMIPSNTVPMPAQTRMEMDKVLAQATGQPLLVPVQKRVAQDEEKAGLVQDTQHRTAEAFQMLTNPAPEPNFYSETYTTESLQSIIDSGSDTTIPSLGGAPAPGMNPLPAPAAVTTDTLDSLIETPTPAPAEPIKTEPSALPARSAVNPADDVSPTSAVLDISTTESRGGAAPAPAAGGIAPTDIIPGDEIGAPVSPLNAAIVAPSTQPTPTPASTAQRAAHEARTNENRNADVSPIRGDSKPALPASTPVGGHVPVGITKPAIAPGVVLQATPNPDNHLKPPATSSIPYNPDWFYARMDQTEISKIVGQYASSDWLLKMEDLGFVYVPDVSDAPRKLEKVPVGAFSRPIVIGQSAVSWYIEEARKVQRPSFEEAKTQAYDTYRAVQLDKATAEKYNTELNKAGIQYNF